MNITQTPSPNFWEGRGTENPLLVVVHIIQGTLQSADAWFADENAQVSAHYGIGLDGTIHQYVQEKDTAWANGTIHKPLIALPRGYEVNPNSYTISIEHEGYDLAKNPLIQLQTSAELVWEICNRWNIPKDRHHIIAHGEIDSVRKPFCPTPIATRAIIDEIVALVHAKG